MFIYIERNNGRSRDTQVCRYLRDKFCASASLRVLLCCYTGCRGSLRCTPTGKGQELFISCWEWGAVERAAGTLCELALFLNLIVKLWPMTVRWAHPLMVKQKFGVPRMCHSLYACVCKQVFIQFRIRSVSTGVLFQQGKLLIIRFGCRDAWIVCSSLECEVRRMSPRPRKILL